MDTGEDFHERAFAGTVFADDREHFTWHQPQAD
jgi:hypothetical protein